MLKKCLCCGIEFLPPRNTSVYCSEPCRTFYQLVGKKLPQEMLDDALVIETEDDHRLFIKSYFYMKNGKLNYQLLSSSMLPAFLKVDHLKYAKLHNQEESLNSQVLVWLYDIKPAPCLQCGCKPNLEIKNSVPSYRTYCSELCYIESMKNGGSARQVINSSIMKTHGVSNVFLLPEIKRIAKERSIETCMERYGVPQVLQDKFMYKKIIKNLNNKSKPEKEISLWLDSIGIAHLTSDYSLLDGLEFSDGGQRKQLDIYCPEYNLAIEFNGTYWHSEIHKYRNYHVEKTNACESKGVQLIHVWEDEWELTPEVVKNLLMAKLGIKKPTGYARQCYVSQGNKEDIQSLLNFSHIQGSVYTASHYLLLRDKKTDCVRAVMTFMKRIVKGETCMELTRFASDGVHGAFSKLLAYYAKNLQNGLKTFSFGDRSVVSRLSNVYLSNGFVETEIQPPDYKYHKPGSSKRIHKFSFRKSEFAKMGYDITDKTEDDLAKESGLVRIWGCGLIRYELPAHKL